MTPKQTEGLVALYRTKSDEQLLSEAEYLDQLCWSADFDYSTFGADAEDTLGLIEDELERRGVEF